MLVLSNTIVAVTGYRITQQIYSGSKTLVYQGIREKDQQSVILKLMRNEYPTFHEIAQFRKQYAIAKSLNITGIVKPYSLESYRNSYVLILEDFGGLSLKDYITLVDTTHIAFLQQFFHIAIQIASTLQELHGHRIIHKDIKPANILINSTTSEVKLTDFSIASLLPKEIQQLTNPNFLEGTLAYISPEQTGRMNRGIDYRSDFYSLGVTFFELLTGQLPFTTNDPMELVHCHIAKQPPKASDINSNVPSILCDIISKLMAKNAEERYQSASGLKHDLEICRNQWQETGNIVPFQLGEQDYSERFVIPEKLYGRQQEVENLLAAFERVTGGTSEIVLVTGSSGIGKTSVVNEVHKPIVRQRSYFIKGKFDQFQRDIPLSGFVQAFQDLIRQLLSEPDTVLQKWKSKILSALGEQAQVIINVIPELEIILGTQPLVTELSGTAAQNRFNLLFQRFIKVFTTKKHPLVLFLDDLQWADITSLKFLQLLICQNTPLEERSKDFDDREKRTIGEEGFLLIGAYRDNEISQIHPLSFTLDEIEKSSITIKTIHLKELAYNHLLTLICDTLNCQEITAIPLTKIVFNKTKGNPFFTHQFLKYLQNEALLKFNFSHRHWQYDINEVKAIALTDDVVEFMALQLEKLPSQTQAVLKLAACIGNEFDLRTLAIIYEKSEVDTAVDLWQSLLEGLVLPEAGYQLLVDDSEVSSIPNEGVQKYKFVHDRVQQAAYSLIASDRKQSIHLKIGQLLLCNLSVEERKDKIFILVNQLNMATELLVNQSERNELAQMNLIAGRKALASIAYMAAVKYLTTSLQLLASDTWETNYDFTLALHETAAEAAYLNGNFELAEQFIEVVLIRAKTLLDKAKVYEIKIQANGAQNKPRQAIDVALGFLKLLGIEFPDSPNQTDTQLEMAALTSNLVSRRIEDLINYTEMTEPHSLVAIRILSNLTSFAYQAVPDLFPLLVFKQIDLSLKYGTSPLSAHVYTLYGTILCGVVGDIEFGYQLGKLALDLLSKFQVREIIPKVVIGFNATIRLWKEHIRETLPPLLEAYSTSLETGNLEFAAYALYCYSYYAYFIGEELSILKQQIENYSHAIKQTNQTMVLSWNNIYLQAVLNLLDVRENQVDLIGDSYNESSIITYYQQANDSLGLVHLYLCKLQICYLLADYNKAIENALCVEKYIEVAVGHLVLAEFHFYDSLARLAVYPKANKLEQGRIQEKVAINQEKIQKWAYHAPMNYLHKFYLVEAERYRVLGQYLEAMNSYEQAITLARDNEYVHEAALANELTGKFYLEWGKLKIAKIYLIDAYYDYTRWGAKAKVDDLEKRYAQVLTPILQQGKLNTELGTNGSSESSTSLSTSISKQTFVASNTSSISDSLDLASVVKASIALSGEIELEQLLSTLMEVVMENAGASKSALILSEGDSRGRLALRDQLGTACAKSDRVATDVHLTVSAVSSNSTSGRSDTEFPSNPVESSSEVPVTLINYVKRTQEILVTDDLKDKPLLSADSYILREQPKSLLCIPIINQGKLLGILYLENNLTAEAFTRERVELLKLIITQAAISLENAILYQNLARANEELEEYNRTLEEKVSKRTQEIHEKNQHLKRALKELQNTQTQLIQSEKMSSLGQMVAGIAHEINNPINFIHGNITHAAEYVESLLNMIAIYQQEFSNSSTLILEKAVEIDLDFIKEDLPKLLDSMRSGTSRIRQIVLGLRNFSRLDEADMKPVDIHEGIDNALMILHHRFKVKSDCPLHKPYPAYRSEIEVIKEYSQLPLVECYPSQLNQVFMNIIANAIDALHDRTETQGKRLCDGYKPTIRIRTELANKNQVMVRIADNGVGIPEDVRQKVFDPFFTTKPVGSGTGLGLSISYQIVVDKHKGSLTYSSVPGEGTEFVVQIPLRQSP
ncbi:AAA family ATPase [Scytonema sp. UIC 10036]|uniref:trifunctional serine/threonine-protein kinase/ATP-binding protein/sensor histidine kinase n=1 Tax=Scytonema sp. UIC 10036 TaxID=2304196 RepID=UPI0012DA8888|nr:ATP-binding sensor histidine kinase [Scytonema sp. UIC 10036]MUG94022.1 AAA family ATPase [Scytonema sp. UIC 10036]